jgi:hypothetical protein
MVPVRAGHRCTQRRRASTARADIIDPASGHRVSPRHRRRGPAVTCCLDAESGENPSDWPREDDRDCQSHGSTERCRANLSRDDGVRNQCEGGGDNQRPLAWVVGIGECGLIHRPRLPGLSVNAAPVSIQNVRRQGPYRGPGQRVAIQIDGGQPAGTKPQSTVGEEPVSTGPCRFVTTEMFWNSGWSPIMMLGFVSWSVAG